MPLPNVTAKQMSEIDRLAVDQFGLEIVMMMENAARDMAELVQIKFPKPGPVLALAGRGNNGADTIASLRHLYNRGYHCSLLSVYPLNEFNELGKKHTQILEKLSVELFYFENEEQIKKLLAKHEIVIDGLLGYQLRGNPRSPIKEIIKAVNLGQNKVFALDLPSGLDPNTGQAASPCIMADYTLTLALPKKGLLTQRASSWIGELWLGDISIPMEVYQALGIHAKPLFQKGYLVKLEF